MSLEDVAFFQKQGAVVLRNVISSHELKVLRDGIDEVLRHPSPRAQIASEESDKGRFFEDFNRWTDVPQLELFVKGTQLGRIGACLMQSGTATLYHDHVLVKEAGTSARTPRHQDQPYYDVEGSQTGK